MLYSLSVQMEFFSLVVVVLALVALVRASGNQRRIGELEAEVARLRVAIEALRARGKDASSTAESELAPEDATPEKPPGRDQWPEPGPAYPPVPPVGPSEPSAAATDHVIPPPPEPKRPEPPPAEPKPPAAQPVAAYSASMDRVEPQTAPPVSRPGPQVPPPSPPPQPPASPPPPPPPPWSERLQNFDWENLIGVKLFSWIAGIALGLAGVLFLKYSFDQGLLQPPVRMAIGMIAGIGLLALCELRIAKQYRVTANALDAAGVAILYATLFSSNAIWHLLPTAVTFALMILVTVVAVGLSIRRESVFIALLGLIGGFATPAMLSSGENHPITLFSYLLMLNAGLAWVAYRKRWPVLAVLALLFTTLYQWGWVVKFLGTSNLPLAVSIFLAFPLLSVGAFFFASKREEESAGSSLFGRSAAVASIVPVTFAIYLAAVPAYGERHHLLFAFLLLVDLGLLVIAAAKRAPEILHAVGAISTVLVVAIWSGVSYSSVAWPSVLVWISALVILYLGAPLALEMIRRRYPISSFEGVGAKAVWAAPLLLFVFPVLAVIEPATQSPWFLFGTLFVLVAASGFVAARLAMPGLYHLAAMLAILAEVMWSVKHLGPETLLKGLIVYAAFALLFIAVPVWTRINERSTAINGAPQLLASFILLFLLAGGAVANLALPGIALLIVILMAGLYLHRSSTVSIVIGIVLSWLVLQTWWSSATLASNLIPALIVLAGLSLLILFGGWWLQRSGEGQAGAWNVYLALVGHMFLLFTASRPELAVPPWPIFAVLALLAIAVAAASHRLKNGGLFVADLIATQAVLIAWAATVRSGSWAATAVVATLVTAAFGLAWRMISGRSGEWDETGRARLAQGAFAGLFLGQIVMIVATRPESPGFALVLTAHLALLIALLALAAQTRWHIAAVLAVVPASMAMALYRDGYVAEYWTREMILASALYLAFVLYPLAIGRRAGKELEPYLAPILMSASYFFFAREGMLLRGLDDVIGALPLAQAAVVAGLLVHLLRIEARGERVMGRLALVAGVALAFVTVAIPLQLEKEWVTIGWALEGAALVWLFRRIQHRGLLWWSAGLLTVVFLRLTFNPAVLTYHARSETAILNWYLYTYVVAAAALFIAARLLPSEDNALVRRFRAGAVVAGTILLFLLLNIEIADFFSKGPTITFNFSAGLAQDLTYTLGWALFAIALLVAGLAARNRPARMAAIGLLLVSVLKGFLRDLMSLGGLYRIASLVGLALALAVVAILLQKYVLSPRSIEEVEPA